MSDKSGPSETNPASEPATAGSGGTPCAIRVRVVACLIGGSGLVSVVVGSFLPWVISGSVRRSSYAMVGVVDRLGIADDGLLALLVGGWPLIGVLCMAPIVAASLRCWRTAGVLGVLMGLAAGLLSVGILLVATGRVALGVRLDPIGPAVMAAGAVLLAGAGSALTLGAGSPVRRITARPDVNDRP